MASAFGRVTFNRCSTAIAGQRVAGVTFRSFVSLSSQSSSSAILRTTLLVKKPSSVLPSALAPKSVVFPAQTRNVVYAGLRPKKTQHRKSQKGFFKLNSGGSLRGTTLQHGNYGLRVIEGGRLADRQIDAARTVIRRVLKTEKGSKFYIRAFPARPITKKPAEVRMGKGKGPVEFFGCWLAKGAVVFEVKCERKELAIKAMQVAAATLPLRTEFFEHKEGESRVAPRCLPHFLKNRWAAMEFKDVVAKRRQAIANRIANKETSANASVETK